MRFGAFRWAISRADVKDSAILPILDLFLRLTVSSLSAHLPRHPFSCRMAKSNEVSSPDSTAAAGGAASGSDAPVNFLSQIMQQDLASGKHKSIVTRFPPEPNGFLHLGHAKSICINFGLAEKFNGRCHMRFDDTNPTKEETRYIESILRDVRWLGGDWGNHLYHASDYFPQLYSWAEQLIEKGLAFVDFDSLEEIRRKRGSITEPGEDSPYRNKFTIEENLMHFRKMRDGEYEEGQCVLRAKIDMAHKNVVMRDPIMYRILKKEHPRTGNKWVIYPMYDYAHGQSDSIEKITHSICTLEFDLNRQLYDWFQEALGITRTRQIEFARLNVTYTVMSKRKLLALVNEKVVAGWDDPRLSTLSALRRRGVPPAAIRDFCERVGVARRPSTIQIELLERCIREYLDERAPRRFAVKQPLLVKITNFGAEEVLTIPSDPKRPAAGSRQLAFTNELYIDAEDFMENPPKEFHRLSPGKEVRLRSAYWIKCNEVEKDANGNITAIICSYDPQTLNCSVAPDGRKVKGTIHWLPAKYAVPAELRFYDRLFTKPFPEEEDPTKPEGSWRDNINTNSLMVYRGFVEADAADLSLFPPQFALQFERLGFFTADAPCEYVLAEKEVKTSETAEYFKDAREYRREPGAIPVFNLTVGLLEGYTVSKEKEEEAKKNKQKEMEARKKAAEERQRKKEMREAAKLEKEKKESQAN
ncbi:glutaminyl-tRNA synthetase, putative [Eimeria tenella]|uniref:glutamine--tRNA ligase n=1 Tax=Eimeria tenella TaxID=5802 RepID=U6KPI1_EIMTE|nr:glutaminyl-tRNA synthetase, putative [Eimeria tenella]CDJ38207.1 glutaminyl-tRNA synthetase, putative [Eimeria tenella]|eukprot:XP_013229045.1 glutaminyl-tRNA synthetase, putative [Eimeria tenella]